MSDVNLVEVFVDPTGPEIIEVMSPGPPGVQGPAGATGATGAGFTSIANGTLLGNDSGSATLPSALNAAAVRSLLAMATTNEVVFSGLSFSGTGTAGLRVKSLTTTEYTALTPANGDLFRDSTTDRIDARLARGTVELIDTAGGQTIVGALTVGGQVVFIAGSKSNPSLRLGYSASNTGLYGSASGTTPGLGLAVFGESYLVTQDSTTGLCIHPAWGFCWGNSQADSTVDAALRRAGVGQIDSRANNGFRSRNLANNADAPVSCSNLTASGTVRAGSSTEYAQIEHLGVSGTYIGSMQTGGTKRATVIHGSNLIFNCGLTGYGTTALQLDGSGNATFSGSLTVNGNLNAASAFFQLSNRVLMTATNSSILRITDAAASAGFSIDCATDGNLNLRNRANTAAGTMTCGTIQSVGFLVGNSVMIGGAAGPIIKNVSGTHTFRNNTDTADAPITCSNLTASGTVRLGTFTVGTLPSAAANTRALAFVTDSNLAFNSTNLGLTVTAGGSTLVPVFSNGTNWVIG